MNKVILMGRLTRNPEVRYSQGDNSMAVARFTLAVDRRFKRDNEATADFISCVAFGRTAEFFEKYMHQGTKVCVEGRIQTGSYTRQDGTKVYTTDVVVENAEFAESKNTAPQQNMGAPMQQGYGMAPQYQSAPAGQGGQPSYGGQASYSQQPSYGSQQSQAGPDLMPQPAMNSRPDEGYMQAADEGFMQIPDELNDEGLPFN